MASRRLTPDTTTENVNAIDDAPPSSEEEDLSELGQAEAVDQPADPPAPVVPAPETVPYGKGGVYRSIGGGRRVKA